MRWDFEESAYVSILCVLEVSISEVARSLGQKKHSRLRDLKKHHRNCLK